MRILSDTTAVPFPDEWYGLAIEQHFWMQWRVRAFLRQLRDLGVATDASLAGFEIGCGSGVLRRQLEAATSWCIDGADLNKEALERSVAERGEELLYDVRERHPELACAYDLLLLFDVIEHVEDAAGFLDAALYHLKPGGWLFVNVPALPIFFSDYDRAAGHLLRYDRTSLRDVLEPRGLSVRDLRYWGLTLVPLVAARTWLAPRRASSDVIRSGFEPPGELVHGGLKALMRVETSLLRRPVLGTSLLAAALKQG